jgi:phage terminase small subunit
MENPRLTKKEKGFANDYIETGNGTQAALGNYDTKLESSAAVIATRLLRKVKIQNYLADKAEDAASMVYELSQNGEAEVIRLNASRDILDRTGFKPVEKSLNVNVEIESETSEDIKNLAKSLNELNRTRTKNITSDGVDSNPVDFQVQD